MLGIAALICALVFLRPAAGLREKISGVIVDVMQPVTGFFRNIGEKTRSAVGGWFSNDKELTEEKLRYEIAALTEENRKLQDIVYRSDVLKREYELEKASAGELLPAKITARAPGSWFEAFTIDVGSADGVQKNATVVAGAEGESGSVVRGLVGKVTEVDAHHAVVKTLRDESIRVSVRSIRTSEGAMMTGMKDGQLEGYMFDRNADVIVGDRFLTSGLGGVFRSGIFVGEVVEVVSDESGLKKNIRLRPAVEVKNLMKVFVVEP